MRRHNAYTVTGVTYTENCNFQHSERQGVSLLATRGGYRGWEWCEDEFVIVKIRTHSSEEKWVYYYNENLGKDALIRAFSSSSMIA